ncbi:MAG: AAA family ATPase, partial [Bacillota bacterium]
NKWVGSSEANLEKALQCIEALAPTVVVLDELDQTGLSRDNSGDSGVSNRLLKRLLEFMADGKHRGRVVFLGLTNRPDLIDAALKRPGRFDRAIPILPPGEEERAEIFSVMFRKYAISHDLSAEDLNRAAAETDGYTGAEIEALVLKAADVAEDAGSDLVMAEHIQYALEVFRPTTGDIEMMTQLALKEANDLDLLPPAYRQKVLEKRDRKLQVITGGTNEGRKRRN